jgi:hypothetical protein
MYSQILDIQNSRLTNICLYNIEKIQNYLPGANFHLPAANAEFCGQNLETEIVRALDLYQFLSKLRNEIFVFRIDFEWDFGCFCPRIFCVYEFWLQRALAR